ncbi:hypothetical protein ACXYTJ_00300 [Gilvimarinus sp. F26214L]|uniref:hypothetical protein n=1 Tax=Gilvimarinus sp. DZF01 TaxID=3461371 RepID=UPI00404597B0
MNTNRVNGLAFLPLLLALSFLTMGSANATEQTTTVRWGPITIPAMGHSEQIAGVDGFRASLVGLYEEVADYDVPKPCEDCYITGIVPNLVTADGATGNYNNGLMLHHVVNFNFSRPDVTCRPNIFSSQVIKQLGGIVGGNERYFAAGNERTVSEMAEGFGYYVAAGDEWGLAYHLMNMAMEEQTVYFEFTFTWEPASEFSGERVRPIWIDIDQCNDSERTAVAGYNDLKWSWEADRSHQVTDIGGHVHDFGISTAWKNETTGDNICTSVAGYSAGSQFAPIGSGTGADSAHPTSYNTVSSDPIGLGNYNGHISDMTSCSDGDSGPKINKGNQMQLHTQIYRPDVEEGDMGIMVGFMDEDFCITNYWCL